MSFLLPVSRKGKLDAVKYILCIYDDDCNNTNYKYFIIIIMITFIIILITVTTNYLFRIKKNDHEISSLMCYGIKIRKKYQPVHSTSAVSPHK